MSSFGKRVQHSSQTPKYCIYKPS